MSRASYVNERYRRRDDGGREELLTPIGEWIAARVLHVTWVRNPWPWVPGGERNLIFRVFGLRPYCRFAILDYTRAPSHGGHRLRVLGFPVFDRARARRRKLSLPRSRSKKENMRKTAN